MIQLRQLLASALATSMITASLVSAQVSPMELGRLQGGAVRIAIWLDHYYASCMTDRAPKYYMLTDSALRSMTPSVSAKTVTHNAAMASGTTEAYLTQHAKNEVDQKPPVSG